MTQKDKIAYSKLYSRFNSRIERYGQSFFYKVLKSQWTNLKPLLSQYDLSYISQNIDSFISEETFRIALSEFNSKAGEKFLKFYKITTIQKDIQPLQNITIAFRDAEKIAQLAKIAQSIEVGEKVTQITETTRKQISDAINEGLALNKTKAEIAKDIYNLTGGTIARNRSVTIARTETTYISSLANEISISDSPFKYNKIWIPVRDFRTRQDHLAMFKHKPIPKEERFNVGGVLMKYPGDPTGGAANVIRCRCALVYEPIKPDVEEIAPSQSSGSLLSGILISELLAELLKD